MSYLIPRALPLRSVGLYRPAVQTQIYFFASRPAFLSTNQAPSSPTKSSSRQNPLQKTKIPTHLRPLSRPPVPPPTKTPEELVSLGYIVRRTPSVQLPIYRKWQSGGTRQVVLIKKVDGNRVQLMEDLVKDIDVAKEDARINPITQHIELKGDHFDKARHWLLERGF